MPKISILPETASVQEIQRNYRRLLDKVKSTRTPLFILRNSLPEAVIVDVKSWNEIVTRLQKEEERLALEAIKTFETERRRGKLKLLKGSLADLI